MKTKTIDVADARLGSRPRHQLDALQHDLSPRSRRKSCWRRGRSRTATACPASRPPQGWDWSAIRDSTPEAKRKMAQAVRRVLKKHGIAHRHGDRGTRRWCVTSEAKTCERFRIMPWNTK